MEHQKRLLLLLHRYDAAHPVPDGHRFTAEPRGPRREQEGNHLGDLRRSRIAETARRYRGRRMLADNPRAYGIDPDPCPRMLIGQVLRDGDQRPVAHRTCDISGHQCVLAGDPDNPSGAGCPHMRQHRVGHAQEPQSLSLHRFHDTGRVGVPGRIQCPGAGCGGMHQAVDPSMHVHHLLDASLHRVLIACIQLQVRAGRTCGADGDRSLGPQAADHRGADQPGPADNQHNFSIKFQVHAV